MSAQPELSGLCEASFRHLGLRHFGRLSVPAHVDFYGSAIAVSFALVGVVFVYAAFLSKLLPDTGNFFIDFFKYDYYFCYLIPLSILPTYIIIYINWMAMRHFEQN